MLRVRGGEMALVASRSPNGQQEYSRFTNDPISSPGYCLYLIIGLEDDFKTGENQTVF